MARVKRGVTAHRRHKKILGKAKGYYNARRKVFRVAKQAVTKALQYAYIGRKQKKRQFRALWIVRINAARPPVRHVLQPPDERPQEGRHHRRPQGAGGHRRARHQGVRRAGRKGEGQSGRVSRCGALRRDECSTTREGGLASFPFLFDDAFKVVVPAKRGSSAFACVDEQRTGSRFRAGRRMSVIRNSQ